MVADGFEVNLFAADPLLAKPIQMNFDPRGPALGRQLRGLSPDQARPDGQRQGARSSRTRDGDGKADKTTVFADGLLIPTGIEPGDGGAYVANSTELLHFKDTDGDGKADRRRVVLSGFGTEDTHHILHTLRWGYDGQLYFNQSIYIHSHIETPHGVRRLGGGGIWQFRPETMELEVFIRGLVQSLGPPLRPLGPVVRDRRRGRRGDQLLPARAPTTSRPPDAVRDPARASTRAAPSIAALEVVSGRHLPETWQGNLLTNDFRGNRVCRFVLSDDGAGLRRARAGRADQDAARGLPADRRQDGARRRDLHRRLVQPDHPARRGRFPRPPPRPHPRPDLAGHGQGPPARRAAAAGRCPDRVAARRAEGARGLDPAAGQARAQGAGAPAVAAALAAWVKGLDPNDPDAEHHAARRPLDLPGARRRRARAAGEPARRRRPARPGGGRPGAAALARPAARPARRCSRRGWSTTIPASGSRPSGRWRRSPARASAELALRALDRPVDRFLDYALWLTARDLQADWLPAVPAGRFDFGGNPRHLVFALQAVSSPAVVTPLLAALRAGRVPAGQEEGVLTTIATLGRPDDLAVVFDLAVSDGQAPAAQRAALLEALMKATEQRKVRPAGDLARLGGCLDGPDDALRAAAARAAGLWKVEPLRGRLVALAEVGRRPAPAPPRGDRRPGAVRRPREPPGDRAPRRAGRTRRGPALGDRRAGRRSIPRRAPAGPPPGSASRRTRTR